MKWIDAQRARLGAMNDARKAKAEEKRRVREMTRAHDPHAHSRFWLLNVPAIATVLAAITEWYWAILFCIEATGRLDGNFETAAGSEAAPRALWDFAFSAHWPVLIGLLAATAPIVMISMVWLPVQFAMRGAGAWRRGSLITAGLLANILVIISGTVVLNYNRQDQVRDAVVIEQTAAQGRAAIDARLAFEQEQLRLALANSNPYLNQAANVGAAEWERSYVAQARATNDPRLPMLERALGAARAADQRRANIERLTIERATAAPEAASAANVEDNIGRELNTFAQYVEVWRPPFVAFICTLIGILGAWWTLAMLERLNPKDVLRSGWADDAHRIEDLREHEAVTPQPMKPAREDIVDAETGERLIRVRQQQKEYLRKAPKGKRQKLDITPDPQPDETGVAHDGGNRAGSVEINDLGLPTGPQEVNEAVAVDAPPASLPVEESLPTDNEQAEQSAAEPLASEHPESSDIPEPDLEAYREAEPELFADDATAHVAVVDDMRAELQSDEHRYPDEQSDEHSDEQGAEQPVDHVELPNEEGVVILETEPERAPETREERLLTASVAAE